MHLSDLRPLLPELSVRDFADVPVSRVVYDSRSIAAGDLFVALVGAKADGHRFVSDAIRQGCAAVVVQRPLDIPARIPQLIVPDTRAALSALADHALGRPTRRLQVFGVTGTNGKTTTVYLLKAMVEAAGGRSGLIGTIAYHIGDREIPSSNTTPESLDLQRYFVDMLDAGLSHCAMEVSSHALVQHRVDHVHFAGAVFANLTRDHLDYHKTPAAYQEAKGRLFRLLEPGAAACLNREDPASAEFAAATRGRVVWYGLGPGCDVSARILEEGLGGTRFVLRAPAGEVEIHTRLLGRHNVYNLLSAAACILSCGGTLEQVARGAAAVECVRGRLDPVIAGQPFDVRVDYAHTEDALRKVLGSLRPVTPGRLIVVFGCGGDRDRGKRPLMGAAVQELADFALVTSDNPRSEEPRAIIAEIEQGMPDRGRYTVEVERAEAIRAALAMARTGDLVLIAGKGHESGQIFRDVVKPFDDKRSAREALASMGYLAPEQ
ncbi:MAG: UDP-N-acetylmuramoyl-L-alanyl-D-glutamate--2,6-diaminopimelate ligase [Planctomycetes bacterium]|nr:UDP-N-acetylmuramoyl-L-alanyl-D-glutamate--2,6-diaminopimelate ligase [Planctomycetota bacterium]